MTYKNAPKAYIELSNANLFEKISGGMPRLMPKELIEKGYNFSKFSGKDTFVQNIDGTWVSSNGVILHIANEKILDHPNQKNIPIDYVTPYRFTTIIDGENMVGTISEDGNTIDWIGERQIQTGYNGVSHQPIFETENYNAGSWKKSTANVSYPNLTGTYKDADGFRIHISGKTIIDHPSAKNIPFVFVEGNVIKTNMRGEDYRGTISGTEDSPTINWIVFRNGNWQNANQWKQLDTTNILAKAPRTLAEGEQATDIAMPTGATNNGNHGIDVNTPGGTSLVNNNTTNGLGQRAPKQFLGIELNTKNIVIASASVVLIGLAIWKGPIVIKMIKGK